MANLIRLPELDDLAFIDEQVEYISKIGIEYARSNTWDRYYFNIGLKTGKYISISLGSNFDWKRLYDSPFPNEIESMNTLMKEALRVITKLRSDIIDLLPVQDIHSIMLTLE